MENQQKIEQAELKKIQEFQEKINDHLLKIGNLEALKAEGLVKFSEFKKEYESFLSELENKYGQVNINIKTGEITEVQEDVK